MINISLTIPPPHTPSITSSFLTTFLAIDPLTTYHTSTTSITSASSPFATTQFIFTSPRSDDATISAFKTVCEIWLRDPRTRVNGYKVEMSDVPWKGPVGSGSGGDALMGIESLPQARRASTSR